MNIVEIRPEEISARVTDLLGRGARLIYASGVDMGVRGIKVNYYFCFDMKQPGEHTITEDLPGPGEPRRPVDHAHHRPGRLVRA